MIRAIKILLKFLVKFGIYRGLFLYLKFLLGRVNHIKLPNVRFSFSLRKHTSDIPTFEQVFLFDEYKVDFINKPSVIIDGGANVGLFAIKMKNDFPESKIICIEPDGDNFAMLQHNLSKYKGVFFENCGLWHKNTKLKVFDKYNLGKWGMFVEEDLVAGTISAISIQALLEKYSISCIDVLKLDIEASEKQLFSEGYEEWLPKVKTIIIELHDWMKPGCSKPFFTAINKCFSNYSFSQIGENVVISNHDLV